MRANWYAFGGLAAMLMATGAARAQDVVLQPGAGQPGLVQQGVPQPPPGDLQLPGNKRARRHILPERQFVCLVPAR